MYVRPHLNYCGVIYNIPFVANEFDSLITLSSSVEHLEKVQYQAALAVTGCWDGKPLRTDGGLGNYFIFLKLFLLNLLLTCTR